jgi:hypothetical protein
MPTAIRRIYIKVKIKTNLRSNQIPLGTNSRSDQIMNLMLKQFGDYVNDAFGNSINLYWGSNH